MMSDDLRMKINRLSLRIVRETGGQAECDKLEVELAALYAQALPVTQIGARRKNVITGERE